MNVSPWSKNELMSVVVSRKGKEREERSGGEKVTAKAQSLCSHMLLSHYYSFTTKGLTAIM